jgi:type II secretory pathway pseudopilin PulG
MKQYNSISSLTRSQGKLYLHSGGSMMLNIIIIMVIFASIISAVVYMSSSSLRQAVSSNQGANAWNMAEAGYRFLSINYLKQTDTNGNGNADDEKAAYLQSVSGKTYVIPQNGSFTLTVTPYWFYNTAATATGRNISVLLPGTTPAGFAMPATGRVKVGNTRRQYKDL